MPKIMPKKPLSVPPKHKHTSPGCEPTHDLRGCTDDELRAELIRRGYRGFVKESVEPVAQNRGKR